MGEIRSRSIGAESYAKRHQIIGGARAVFLAQGLDAASMGDIARKADVSKGTLYTYFESKEKLFEVVFEQERWLHSERLFAVSLSDADVESVLKGTGAEFVRVLLLPATILALRTVIGASGRMPQIARKFYEAGKGQAISRLASYLQRQMSAGVLRVQDCDVAAAQFLDSCHSTLFEPLLYGFGDPPDTEQIDYVVGNAVRAFLAANK